ncbi:MAG: alpha/beta fold hydrolase [bacterium]|nr:alpha/beta fold hydrolase [bacterium]
MAPAEETRSGGDYVVLLHGLGRTARSMRIAERYLERCGYRTVNVDYPSRRYSIEGLADRVGQVIDRHCPDERHAIHAVTHSLGGIVMRCLASRRDLPRLSRVVMLSPPNQGSSLADRVKGNPVFRAVAGPAGQQLGTESRDGLPAQLGEVSFELGVIAGSRSLNPWAAAWVPGPNDGTVGVDEARVEGMRDFLVVSRGHTFIMNDPDVLRQVLHFLRHGCFDRSRP